MSEHAEERERAKMSTIQKVNVHIYGPIETSSVLFRAFTHLHFHTGELATF